MEKFQFIIDNAYILTILVIVFFSIILKFKKLHSKKGNKKFNINFMQQYNSFSREYKSFTIPKRNWGQRIIDSPNKDLMNIQKDLLSNLEKSFIFPTYVTAFIKNRWIKNNANKHISKKIVINIDIENFFHSITSDKIRDSLGYYKWVNKGYIENFIDIITYKWRLPQWSPTSPFIANLVFLWIDSIIISILKRYDKNVWYSRYADDITFSSNNEKIKDAIRIITDWVLPKYWYKAKKKKTTIYRNHRKQLVTWLIVNEKVSYPRNKYMILRSSVYNFLKTSKWDLNKIKWHLSFLKSVDRKKYHKLKFYYRIKFKTTKNYDLLFKKWKKNIFSSAFWDSK